jgi:phospholipid/cholesterol/gamma-HCH transport system permease protein
MSDTILSPAIAAIGRPVRRRAALLLMLAALALGVLGEAVRPRTWQRTLRAEFRRTLRQAWGSGLVTTLVTAVLAGLAMVAETLCWLGLAGEQQLADSLLVTVLIREITPLVIEFVLLGRSGTVAVHETGTLQLGGQARSLAAQGVDPFLLLVLPRTFALALASFTLCVLFALTALVVGFVSGSILGSVQGSLLGFLDYVLAAMRPVDSRFFRRRC